MIFKPWVSKSQWMSLVLIENYSKFSSKILNRSRYEFRSILPVASVHYSYHFKSVSLTVACFTFLCPCVRFTYRRPLYICLSASLFNVPSTTIKLKIEKKKNIIKKFLPKKSFREVRMGKLNDVCFTARNNSVWRAAEIAEKRSAASTQDETRVCFDFWFGSRSEKGHLWVS